MMYYNKKTKNRYLARRETFKTAVAYIPCAIGVVFCVSTMIALPLCDQVVNGYMFLLVLKFCLYALPIVLLLVALRIFYVSGYVTFEDDHLIYYRFWFSKKCKTIPLDSVTECVAAQGLRKRGDGYSHMVGIYLYNRNNVLCKFEDSPKLLLKLYLILGDQCFRFVGDNLCLRTIDKFFHIDFSELTEVQQLALFKYYCKLRKENEIDGEKYLKKKKLL